MTADPEFVRRGLHKLFCSPYEPILEGPKKGRLIFHRELAEPFGTGTCECATMPFKVNGVDLPTV